ncbi:MAG: MOSC domain-containing protein [Planctomycetota bacterium]|jgi:MOSC domain-containing protein YiiM
MSGTIESIHIADEEDGPLRAVTEAVLVPGRGIEGDRYSRKPALAPHQELTLVEAEQVEAFAATTGLAVRPHETRRNVVTRGIGLNGLVGRTFTLGGATLRGVELCEPCASLGARLAALSADGTVTAAAVVAGLTGRAGLRARILDGATIRPGDRIALADGPPPT